MSLARGKFGIEYNPRQTGEGSSGLGWVFAAVAFLTLVSLVWTVAHRIRAKAEQTALEATLLQRAEPAPAQAEDVRMPSLEPVVPRDEYAHRTARVRNLLMRLEEANRRKDVEMAVTTIEAIRALPGLPAADLDDSLARRLGTLNLLRLFEGRNAQWVKQVTVRRGDSASRIAAENGSTFASFARLNGGKVDKVILGSKVYVMDHPRFNLAVRRRTRTADLSLNGKFFKRYDLKGGIKVRDGAYVLKDRSAAFWSAVTGQLKAEDRRELEMLLPNGSNILISEM